MGTDAGVPAGRLAGKVAIVTGGGSGIGEASCRRFAAEGAAVVVADRDADGARRVAAAIDGVGGRALAVEVDVTSEAGVAAMAAAAGEFGSVDVLYANAGIA